MKALVLATLPDMERALQESRDSWQRHVGGVEMLKLLLVEQDRLDKEAEDAVPKEDDS